MSESIINPTSINIYGINSFINKFEDSKLDILDLDLLKSNFKIDYEFDSNTNQIEETELPAFTQLTYNERISSNDSSYSTSYNRPPLGPIENFCYCSYCNNISPQYHSEECPFPEKKSLFLTIKGVYYYIIQTKKSDFSENLNKLKEKWINNELTQDDLNKILLIPNSVKIGKESNIDSISLDDSFTKIQYFDVVKLRGPTKLEYTTATQKFSNAIMLSYEYSKENLIESDTDKDNNTKKTSIRIYKNGLINLINIPDNKYDKEILYKTLIDRINESSDDVVNIDFFNRLASEYTMDEYDEYTIIDKVSYIHSVNSQFNMWQVKDKYSIDFRKLNELISPFNSSGRIVSGEYTTVTTLSKTNKQVIELNYNNNSVYVVNWEHTLGKDTRTQSLSREEIKCIILPIDGIKISLQIHKHGTFQMSMSYCNASDLKNSICSKIVNKSVNKLDFKYFEIVKNIFVGILTEKNNLVGNSLDYFDENAGTIRNTVSGNAPPNKPGTSTAVCRSSDPRPGYPGLRPIPYSFNGQCPESRQYIDPIGVLGNDGLYYPCCSAKTKKSEEDYKQYLIYGFPKNKTEEEIYGVNKIEDTKSGILKPGSINIGANTRAKINGVYEDVKILGYKGKSKKPQEIIVQFIKENRAITINRKDLERDSRYIPGLKNLNKEQLINCIIKNLQLKKKEMSLLELENLNQLKQLIDLPEPNFNPILSIYDISIFEKIKYNVTSVPSNSNIYYFYISPEENYFINTFGNKKSKSLNENINEKIIFFGFLESTTEKYYITDIIYFNKKISSSLNNKIEMLKEIEETYFLTETNIEFPVYSNNIIKGSKELLQESSDIFLIFTPEEDNYLKLKIWSNISIEPEITLQIIRKNKTNYFTLGYENNTIKGLPISFDSIFIPKVFIENNKININDYVLFKFDYNLQTGLLSTRFLTPLEKTVKPQISLNETLIKLSLIINPIKESFFMNNKLDDEYIWNIPGQDKILKSNDDKLPLINYV